MVKRRLLTKVGPVSDLNAFLKGVRDVRVSFDKQRPRFDAREDETDDVELWFRGQPCARMGLVPKLMRAEYAGADEAEIRYQFESRAIQLVAGGLPSGKWERYFLMQHYGTPTRLLDWTGNPLVALYFALEAHPREDSPRGKKSHAECAATIWVLAPGWLNHEINNKLIGPILPDWMEAKGYLPKLRKAFDRVNLKRTPAAIDPPHLDRRISAQESHFVIFGRAKDLSKTHSIKQPKGSHCLARIDVSRRKEAEIRKEIEDCGINWASMFPDLTGLCTQLQRDFEV